MRIYLELVEVLPPDSTEEPDFIRVDVTDWSKEDVDNAIQLLREHAKQYQAYILQIHYCNHDSGGTCSFEVIQ